MSSKALDLVLVVAGAALAMTLMLHTAAGEPLRLFFALPLVLLLPGYAIAAALFPGRALGVAERAACSVGLSLAVAALGGLVLDATPGGLQAQTWAALLGNITLVASLAALLRRLRTPALPAPAAATLTQGQVMMFGLAAALACGALVIARDGALQRPVAGFTQLWVLPADAPGQGQLRLGLASMEPGATRYRLELRSGGALAAAWPTIVLGPEQRWEELVDLPPTLPGVDAEIEAVLYRLDAPDAPYRRAVLRP